MAVAFSEAVRNLHHSLSKLLEGSKKLENERRLCTWSYVSTTLVSLLHNYPTGLTKPVILSELLAALSLPQKVKWECISSKASDQHEKKKKGYISELNLTKQVELSWFIECFIDLASKDNTEGETRVVRLVDREHGSSTCGEKIPTMEMYLHQKACYMERYICKYPLRMTDLRIHQVGEREIYRLLPTEFVVPVLDAVTDKEFISENFGNLEGILDEDAFPHYTRNVLVTITEIGALETIYNPFGDDAIKIVVCLIDSNSVIINLILWDEAVAFERLMDVGDSLCIEDPFFVKYEEDAHLEYGPATIFFSIPAKSDPPEASLEPKYPQVTCNKRVVNGKLDFGIYPYQVASTDVVKDCVNINFIGVVKSISYKHFSEKEGVQFLMEIFDDFGVLEVQVYDNSLCLHERIHPGQMVLLENIETDECSNCILKTSNLGRLSIITALKGYVASPCLYTVSNGKQLTQNGTYFIVGKIIGYQSINREFIRRIHLTCLKTVKQTKEGRFFCTHCKTENLMEAPFGKHEVMKNLSLFWKWRYDFGISLELKDLDDVRFDTTDEVCQELVKLSAQEFSRRSRNARNSMVLGSIGKTCVFCITLFEHIRRVDAFEFASERFLENLICRKDDNLQLTCN